TEQQNIDCAGHVEKAARIRPDRRPGADRALLVERRIKEIEAVIEGGRAVDVGELHLEYDLRLDGRHVDAQQVYYFAKSRWQRPHSLGGGQTLHAAAQERGVVFKREIDIFVGKIGGDLGASRFQLETADADGQVVDESRAILLPHDQRRLAWGESIDQNFF